MLSQNKKAARLAKKTPSKKTIQKKKNRKATVPHRLPRAAASHRAKPLAEITLPKDHPDILKRRRLHSRFRRAMRQELANLLTHGIGAGLAIAGTGFLVARGVALDDPWRIVSYSLFGFGMIFLYLASSLYHALWKPKIRQVLRRLDHSAIFLMIAGTYTPILLVTLRGALGWSMFGVVWALALIGITFKIIFGHRYEAVSLSAYILMGWLVIFFVKPVYIAISGPGLWLLIAGGISYTAGTIFYSITRLPYHHMVWHLFVLGGSACHFLCIYLYV